MRDLTTAAGVVEHMRSSVSEHNWNARLEEVKRANGGQYPSFWYSSILAPQVHKEVARKWGGSGEIDIALLKPEE